MAKKNPYFKEYGCMIINVDDVLAYVKEVPMHKVMRAVLREYGVRGRLNDSQFAGLWNDSSGGITFAMHLDAGFWKLFEMRAPEMIDPGKDIEVARGAEEFVKHCPYSQTAYVFNSPKIFHEILLKRLGIQMHDAGFVSGFHFSDGSSLGATKSLSRIITHALEDLEFHPSFSVYIDSVDDMKTGYRCAKGNNVDYFGIDPEHRRGTKTRHIIGTVVGSLAELIKRISFFDREEYLRRLDELENEYRKRLDEQEDEIKKKIKWTEDLLEKVEDLDPKKPSRKNKKNRNRH